MIGMKTIILISSIFYILGLKLGHKVDLLKRSIPVKKIITNTISEKVKETSNLVFFNEEAKKMNDTDSLKTEENNTDIKIKSK